MTEHEDANEPVALYEIRDRIAIITFNRPAVLNAVNAALSTAVGQFLAAAAVDHTVRVVVITGKGRAFCAGADLKELAQRRPLSAEKYSERGFGGIVRHWIDKPVIAAVNGLAMGGGTEIVLACDLVVAAETAVFGLPEVKRGILATGGGVVRLQRQIPLKRAMELALTGDPIDAFTAEQWGMVNKVATVDSVLPVALELADCIASNAPLSVVQTKRMLHRTASAGSDWDNAWTGGDPWEANAAARRLVFSSQDAAEGPRAFAEKRDPKWSGQ